MNRPVGLHRFRWSASALWALGTAAGWAAGIVPAMLVITGTFWNGTDSEPNMAGQVLMVLITCSMFCFIGGAAVGAAQWLILRQYLGDQADRWFQVTAIAGAAGWVLGWLTSLLASLWPIAVFHDSEEVWLATGAIGGATAGIAAGIGQWRILSRWVAGAVWWVVASGTAWTAAGVVYWLVYASAGGPFHTVVTSYYDNGRWPRTIDAPGAGPAMLAGWVASGLVAGIITALALKLLTARAIYGELATP